MRCVFPNARDGQAQAAMEDAARQTAEKLAELEVREAQLEQKRERDNQERRERAQARGMEKTKWEPCSCGDSVQH
jgi:benzoyl-CoA reductase/2-hydroxyglutaryl-CoA dehydratase subunit BcrC/BadD/HgdB